MEGPQEDSPPPASYRETVFSSSPNVVQLGARTRYRMDLGAKEDR
jgi:hypothetical protein